MKIRFWTSCSVLLTVLLFTGTAAQLAWSRGAGSSAGGMHSSGSHGGGYHGGANYSGSHQPPSTGGGYFRGSGVHGSFFGNSGVAGSRVGPGYYNPNGANDVRGYGGAAGMTPYPHGGRLSRYYRGSGAFAPGYLGWGYGGWGWGYPGWGFGYGYWPYFDYGSAWGLYGGYGGYQGSGGYGFGYPHEGEADGYTPAPSTLPPIPTPEDDFEVQATVPPTNDYAARGVQEFSAGRYREAIHQFRHAILDEPHNGRLMLLLGQALFAAGRYEEAAGAAEMGMRILPEDKWGQVVKDFSRFYPNAGPYESQIKDLEKARTGRPEAPALRVLLGYHYGYLGFPKQAVAELDKAITLEPRDPYAAELRNLFGKQLGLTPVPVPKTAGGIQPLKESPPKELAPPEKQSPETPPEPK